jgi:hypothetical protein
MALRHGDFVLNRLLLQVLVSTFAITSLSTDATAAVKTSGDLGHIQTVAVVGYSFNRYVQFESEKPWSKPEIPELTKDDPEYLLMQEADERVLEALQSLGTFSVMPREEVLSHEYYVDETNDPSKKLNLSWYFPKGYREAKLKKKSAIAFCEELGVDAVLLIEFKHSSSSKSSSTMGIYGKETTFIALKGEITMFDSTGKELISGSAKSESLPLRTTQGWGDQDDGISFEKEQDVADEEEFWPTLLAGFLGELEKDLAAE